MSAIGGGNIFTFYPDLNTHLTHEAQDPLVIDGHILPMQLCGDSPISVIGILVDNPLNLLL